MWRLRAVLFALGVGLLGCSENDVSSGDQTITLASGGVALVYPATWADRSEGGMLVLRHANARIVITAEPMRSDAAALDRLDSIADERPEPARRLVADGRPALQRRHQAVAPLPDSARAAAAADACHHRRRSGTLRASPPGHDLPARKPRARRRGGADLAFR
jgi:hypothetical protein